MKFKKKPVEIDAWLISDLLEADKLPEDIKAAVGLNILRISHEFKSVRVFTLDGVMMGDSTDWLIKGINGEFYPCKPDIFAATYEVVV